MTQQHPGTSLGSHSGSDDAINGIEEHIAQDWDILSRSLGLFVQPVLTEFAEHSSHIKALLFCTSDGLNVCTLGVRDNDVGRLSALTSSVFSVAAAHRKVMDDRGMDNATVQISSGDDHTVLVAVRLPGLGNFVLGAYAEGIQLGLLLVQLRQTATRIHERLSADRR
ncbi:hypothetical protein JQN72_09425 [Phycicoccus sp. CSK15P-2]|uniref:hypothetical protein n=1 Tax=Phycicoccus sp. CSK15P-2 TaxID=2807627 RepID=UPI0019517015|nr:hypothetical protein [Phycicoccus sp. CSK15P-2]MBM6404460.1 hypothetical protein [Phycicoccus sp. CSK15P-2]